MPAFYIAFSIHGSDQFIIATHDGGDQVQISEDAKTIRIKDQEFKAVRSRRPDYQFRKDGLKLHWDKLLTQKGVPLRSAAMVLSRFRWLEALGFKIKNKEEFIKKHYTKH